MKHRGLPWWAKVDWTKQNCVLAEELGVAVATVRGARVRLRFPEARTKGKWRRSLSIANGKSRASDFWRALDWSKQNIELARETRMSRERVRQVREILFGKKS